MFVGIGIAVERRAFWLPGLHHRVLHQKRGNCSCGSTSQDLSAGRAGDREQANQQQSGTKEPSGTEEERLG